MVDPSIEIAKNGYSPIIIVPTTPMFPEIIVKSKPIPLTKAARVESSFVYFLLTTKLRFAAKINAVKTETSISKRLSNKRIASIAWITKNKINTKLGTESCINLLRVSFSHFPSRLKEEI